MNSRKLDSLKANYIWLQRCRDMHIRVCCKCSNPICFILVYDDIHMFLDRYVQLQCSYVPRSIHRRSSSRYLRFQQIQLQVVPFIVDPALGSSIHRRSSSRYLRFQQIQLQVVPFIVDPALGISVHSRSSSRYFRSQQIQLQVVPFIVDPALGSLIHSRPSSRQYHLQQIQL